MNSDTASYINPFPGLRAFEEHEDIIFFGREKQIDELLKKLRIVRFLAVVGSSGSGKSSLVKSGLIPALHSGFMSGSGSRWKICSFRPGNDPIGNLAKALAQGGMLYDEMPDEDYLTFAAINESTLRRSGNGLIEAYRQSGIDHSQNLLILVDQFEEIFRFSQYEKQAGAGKRDSIAFVNLLLQAVNQSQYPIYVVLTMRSDFLGECTEFRGLPEAINQGQYLVPRMTRDERKEAISGPIAVAGGHISNRLLNLLLNDMGDNPDQLPILQHALMRTWDLWYSSEANEQDPPPIDVDDYERIGTMQQALSLHAEEAYGELGDDQQRHICQIMFKALTDKGINSAGIRRPRELKEIAALAECSIDELIHVIEVFRKNGRAFLMPPYIVPLAPDTIIDISHESLMRVWERLIAWVEDENESRQIYLRLCESAQHYEIGSGALLSGPELQLALKWQEEHKPNKVWASRYNELYEKAMLFLEHSKQQYILEIEHKEKLQKQKLFRARRTVGIISLIALAAIFLAIYSFELRNEANRQTAIAENRGKEALEQREEALRQQQIAEENKEQALIQKEFALEETKRAESKEKEALAQKNIADEQRLYAFDQRSVAERNARLAQQQQEIAQRQTGLAQQNEQIAKEQTQLSSRLKDLALAHNLAYEALVKLDEHLYDESKQMALQAYTLNKNNQGAEQDNDIYAALYKNWENQIQFENRFSRHQAPIKSIVFHTDAQLIISGDESGRLIISQTNNGRLTMLNSQNLREDIRSIVPMQATNDFTVITASGTIITYQLQKKTGALQEKYRSKIQGIGKAVVYSPDGKLIAISNAGVASFQSTPTGIVQQTYTPTNNLTDLTTTKEGVFLSTSNKIFYYEKGQDIPDTPKAMYEIKARISSIAIDPSETYLLAGCTDGRLWVKNIKKDSNPIFLNLHASAINDIQFRPGRHDHVQLATASSDQTVKLWDFNHLITTRNTTENVLSIKGHNQWVYGIAYTANGSNIYSCSEDRNIIGYYTNMASLFNELRLSNLDKITSLIRSLKTSPKFASAMAVRTTLVKFPEENREVILSVSLSNNIRQ
ncbi:hypothetical protein [Olivibacter sitiensis]|uniref:nSTAND1 domain-containing NTPase n=1 Tax=Olivibacter sitiensis TaxID=376470 RepID=UPI00041FC9B7|nr:hypothetical protein [Olivibacter sitiensis]